MKEFFSIVDSNEVTLILIEVTCFLCLAIITKYTYIKLLQKAEEWKIKNKTLTYLAISIYTSCGLLLLLNFSGFIMGATLIIIENKAYNFYVATNVYIIGYALWKTFIYVYFDTYEVLEDVNEVSENEKRKLKKLKSNT